MRPIREYFEGWPEYLGRAFQRVDLICGGVIAVAYFFLADHLGLGNHRNAVTVVILVLSLIEAGYGVYREERGMRAEREKRVRITAKIGAFAANFPDPGPDKTSIQVRVVWEIWTDQDVATDRLALNMIYKYDRSRWHFWKRTRFPKTGISPKGGSTQYRKSIRVIDPQPFRDAAEFEYVTNRDIEGDPHWLLELVIVTGIPAAVHRIPIAFEDEYGIRGTNPPL